MGLSRINAWYKRIAIALLAGVGGGVASLPVSALLLFNQFNTEAHNNIGDGESSLHALALAVLIALIVAAICFAGTLSFFAAGAAFGLDFGLKRTGKPGTLTDPQLLEGTTKRPEA